MPSTISHVKAVKILHHYFTGMPQLTIAQKCLVNQSTVSRCAEKFEKVISAKGIIAAAKEYQVMNEVSALRSLAIDLYKSKVSIEEAKAGLKMVAIFNSLDVPTKEYKLLGKMFKKLKDPEFTKAGMKLVKLEESTGKDYIEIVSEFEKLGEEITVRQEVIAALKENQEKEKKSLEELELTREEKKAEVDEFLKEAEQKKAAADAEVNKKLAEAELTLEKVAKVHSLVEKMNALGITDDKLETFVKEHLALKDEGISWEKFQTVAGALAKTGEIDGEGLVAKLEEYGTLDKTITSMRAEKATLQPEVEKLGKDKTKLIADVDGLVKSKTQLENEVGHLEGSKKALDDTIKTLDIRRTHLEKHVAALESDVTDLTAKKAVLTEEASQKQSEISEMNEHLKKADAISQTLMEKQVELQELDANIADAGQNFKLYEAFLGLVGKRSGVEIEKFLKFVPTLIEAAKTGDYDPGFLVDTVLGQLSGSTLDQLGCDYCGAEFVMLKRGQKVIQGAGLTEKTPTRCPDCGELLKTVVKTPLGLTLKKVIITKMPTLKKPGATPPDEKNLAGPEAGK